MLVVKMLAATKICVKGCVNGIVSCMDVDLYQQLVEIIDEHAYIFGNDTNCPCGEPGILIWPDYRDHMAQLICDLLIDLADTGQLLASIARIARTTKAERDPHGYLRP